MPVSVLERKPAVFEDDDPLQLLPERVRFWAGTLRTETIRASLLTNPLLSSQDMHRLPQTFKWELKDSRGTTHVLTLEFQDKAFGLHRRIESGSEEDKPWEAMTVELSANGASIVHKSRGIYGRGEETTRQLKEMNNSFAVARSQVLTEVFGKLRQANRSSKLREPDLSIPEGPRPLGEKIDDIARELFEDVGKLVNHPREALPSSVFLGFMGSKYSRFLEVPAGDNGEYTDTYTLLLREESIAILRRVRTSSSGRQISSEELKVEVRENGVAKSTIEHKSQGIWQYGSIGNQEIKTKDTTTAYARGKALYRRLGDAFGVRGLDF